jgi:hypothetical protein
MHARLMVHATPHDSVTQLPVILPRLTPHIQHTHPSHCPWHTPHTDMDFLPESHTVPALIPNLNATDIPISVQGVFWYSHIIFNIILHHTPALNIQCIHAYIMQPNTSIFQLHNTTYLCSDRHKTHPCSCGVGMRKIIKHATQPPRHIWSHASIARWLVVTQYTTFYSAPSVISYSP